MNQRRPPSGLERPRRPPRRGGGALRPAGSRRWNDGGPGTDRPGRSRRLGVGTAAAIVVIAALVTLVAACGGSPGSRVAQLGTASTPSGPLPSSPSAQVSGAVAFSRCVRAHGVPAYPDPGSGGLLPKKTPQQLGVASSELQAAQAACIHLVPNGGQPTAAQVQQYRGVMLIYARCMRDHGVSNMPDPDSHGRLAIGPGTGVDVNSQQFQAAFQACKSRLSP